MSATVEEVRAWLKLLTKGELVWVDGQSLQSETGHSLTVGDAPDDDDEKYDCVECYDGTVASDICDICDERHCPECEPCE